MITPKRVVDIVSVEQLESFNSAINGRIMELENEGKSIISVNIASSSLAGGKVAFIACILSEMP